MIGDIRSRPSQGRPKNKGQKEPGSARSDDSSRGTNCSTRSSTPLTRSLEVAQAAPPQAVVGTSSSKVDDSRSDPHDVSKPKTISMMSKRELAAENLREPPGVQGERSNTASSRVGAAGASSSSKPPELKEELSEQTKSEILKVALDALKALNKSSGGRRAYEGRESHVHQVYNGIFRHSSSVEELAWQQLFRGREFQEPSAPDELQDGTVVVARAPSPVDTQKRAEICQDGWQDFRKGRPDRWIASPHCEKMVDDLHPSPRSMVAVPNDEISVQPHPANCESDREISVSIVQPPSHPIPPKSPSAPTQPCPPDAPCAPSAPCLPCSAKVRNAPSNLPQASSSNGLPGNLIYQDEVVPPARRSGQGFERPAAGAGSAAARRHCQGGPAPPLPPSGPGSNLRLPPRPGTWNDGSGRPVQAIQRLISFDLNDANRARSQHSPPTSAPAAPGVSDSSAFANTFPRSSSDCRGTSDSVMRNRPSWNAEGGYTDSPGLPSLTSAPAIVSSTNLEPPSASPIDNATSCSSDLTKASGTGSRSWREAHRAPDAGPSAPFSPLSPLRVVGTQCRGSSLPVAGGRPWVTATAVARCSV